MKLLHILFNIYVVTVVVLLLFVAIGLNRCEAWEWDNTDKTMFTASTVLQTMDFMQTSYIYDNKEYYEINPVIDWGVDRIGKGFVPLYFAAGITGRYLIADKLRPKWRKVFLGACIAVSGYLVYHNNSIGIGFSF